MGILVTTQSKRDAWAAAGYLGTCRNGSYVDLKFFGKGIGGVPVPLVDAYRALEQVLKQTGYTPYSRWALNMRKITGGSAPCTCSSYNGCSPHSFGIAIDIDPADNPYTTTAFSWSKTLFNSTQIAAVEAIKNTKGEKVWSWGGRWSSVRDYMHFEVQVDPKSTAINWNTVKGGEPTNGGVSPDEEIAMKRGDSGKPVAEVQRALRIYWKADNGVFPPFAAKSIYDGQDFSPGEDGDFGGTMETNVKNFQTFVGLPVTGIVDQTTLTFILSPYASSPYGGGGSLSAADQAALKFVKDGLASKKADTPSWGATFWNVYKGLWSSADDPGPEALVSHLQLAYIWNKLKAEIGSSNVDSTARTAASAAQTTANAAKTLATANTGRLDKYNLK